MTIIDKTPEYSLRSDGTGHGALLESPSLRGVGWCVSNRKLSEAMLAMSFVANQVETSMAASITNSLIEALQLLFCHSSRE
jgi:hypothetical protein